MAQVSIDRNQTTTKELIKMRAGTVQVTQRNQFVFLHLRTSNQFDKPFILTLGKGIPQAIASLDSFIDIVTTGTENQWLSFNDAANRPMMLAYLKMSGVKCVGFSAKGYAGNAYFYYKDIMKIRETLAEMNNQ